MSQLTDLKPQAIWAFFEAITRIPRPSKHEEKIRKFLTDFADERTLKYKVDKTGNVLIMKEASAAMKGSAAVVLQSHMDMVCEKNSDVNFDFMKDPIQVRIENGWVRANGTTLGADCGIGMAAALAVLDDKELEHGPIEALFTVDEETGLTGAFGLDDKMLTGKYLINLDSEDEGEIFIGCAGGVDTIATFISLHEPVSAEFTFYRVSVSGLLGGHSGDNINDGLANANKIITRLLWSASTELDMRISILDGGNLRNAIPREALAVVGIHNSHARKFEKMFENVSHDCMEEYKITEPSMQFTMNQIEHEEVKHLIDRKTQYNILSAIQGSVNGVLAMSRTMPGLVETSTNLASVKFGEGGRIIVTSSQRSSVESAKWDAAKSVEAIFKLGGAEVVHSEGYPGWNPDTESALLKTTVESYRKLFGTEPKVRAIHAGLECGLFLQKYPQLQMVSFGPTLRGVHSPDERLEISTVDKFWKLLTDLLARLKD